MVAWVFFRASDMASAFAVLAGMAGRNGISMITALDLQAYGILIVSAVIAFWMPNTNELFLSADNRETKKVSSFSIFHVNWSPDLRWGLAVGFIFALCVLSIYKAKDFIYAQF